MVVFAILHDEDRERLLQILVKQYIMAQTEPHLDDEIRSAVIDGHRLSDWIAVDRGAQLRDNLFLPNTVDAASHGRDPKALRFQGGFHCYRQVLYGEAIGQGDLLVPLGPRERDDLLEAGQGPGPSIGNEGVCPSIEGSIGGFPVAGERFVVTPVTVFRLRFTRFLVT